MLQYLAVAEADAGPSDGATLAHADAVPITITDNVYLLHNTIFVTIK